MGFWFFMMITDLLIPAVMIVFGWYFIKKAPKKINYLFGYRTDMSMKNEETWKYAHIYIGRLWLKWGLIILPLTIVPMLLVIGKPEDTICTVGTVICFLQMIPLIGSIFPTEKALDKMFDEKGIKR